MKTSTWALESQCGTAHFPLEMAPRSGSVLQMKCSKLVVADAAVARLTPWVYSTCMATSGPEVANASKKFVKAKIMLAS